MKLRSVYFERNVPIGDGNRVDELHIDGDPWQPHAGWQSLERLDDGSVLGVKVDRDTRVRRVTFDGYAYTYEAAESDSADGTRVLPPRPVSSAESGAAVDQGLTGAAGSTPARPAKGKRR